MIVFVNAVISIGKQIQRKQNADNLSDILAISLSSMQNIINHLPHLVNIRASYYSQASLSDHKIGTRTRLCHACSARELCFLLPFVCLCTRLILSKKKKKKHLTELREKSKLETSRRLIAIRRNTLRISTEQWT